MNFDEAMRILGTSEPEDWLRELQVEEGIALVYKGDLNLRVVDTHIESDFDRRFSEPWADSLSFHPPQRRIFEVYYGATKFHVVYMVWIDQRAMLPIPKTRDDLVVTPWQYNFAKIVTSDPEESHIYSPMRYMRMAGITVGPK